MPESVLEFKAKDGAWYAGTGVLEGPFLRVHFEHFPEEEDERWLPQKFKSPQDAKKMIRPASQPMQDHQCSSLRRGIFLCVACRHSDSECFEYYDAKLQQIHRSPHKFEHDGEECCMCQFEVEWLGGPLAHKRHFVTCGDICLKTHGDIEDDPVIKEYLAEVKKLNTVSEKDGVSSPKKRKPLSSRYGEKEQVKVSPATCEQSALKDEFKGSNRSIQCGKSSSLIREGYTKKEENTEEQPLKKICINPQSSKSSEPRMVSHSLPDLNQLTKAPADVIQIDSDVEEDCKPSSRLSHTQTAAVNDVSATKSVEDDCSKLDDSRIPRKPSPSVVDGCSTHNDFSGLSKEQIFSSVGGMAACPCGALQRSCFKCESSQCEALGFIPITPFHLTNFCSYSDYSHIETKPSCRCMRSGHVCTQSTSQAFHKNCYPRVGIDVEMQGCEENGDTKQVFEADTANNRKYFCEGVKGFSHTQFLLVENIEKDVVPSNALKAVRKVTYGALMMYIWPSLDYETTRKGYICYQNSEAADAAYQNLSSKRLFIVSSKGRPWIVSKPQLNKLDWFQMYSISAALAMKVENAEDNKESGDLLIIHRGTEEFTKAVGKQKLFLEQQKRLHLCYLQFIDEEKALEVSWLGQEH